MKRISKLFLAFLLFMCMVGTITITLTKSLNPIAVKAEDAIVVADDFTTTQISSSNVYKSNGVGSDANVHGVVPGGWGDPVTISTDAYLMYKIESNSGKFETLKLDLNAKIWNQNDGDAHWENSIVVYAGTSEVELNEAGKIGACAGNYDMAFDFKDLPTIDLSSIAKGQSTIYVKIALVQSTKTGASQELAMLGLKLAKVSFAYTVQEEAKSTMEDDFTTTQISSSNVYKSNGVGSDANVHGVVPGGWGDPVTIAQDSYILYKLDSKAGEFASLVLDLNAKIWNQNDGDAHWENSIVVYAGTSEAELNEAGKIGACAGNYDMAFDFKDLPTIDLSNIAKGQSTIYVKIALVQSTKTGASQELAMLGLKLAKVKFTYSEQEAEGPAVEYVHLTDNFGTTPVPNCKAEEVVGIGGDGNATHGAVPGAWGDPVTIADESYLVYKVVSEKGFFDTLTLDINAKIWNQNNAEAHEYNAVNVYAGTSKSNMKMVAQYKHQGDSGAFTDLTTINLGEIAKGEHVVYVKIELKNSVAIGENQELAWLGVKLMKVDFQYTEIEAECVSVTYVGIEGALFTDSQQIKGATLNGYQAPEVEGYTFKGWFLDDKFETELPQDYKAEGEISLYAKYEETRYAINYELNGGVNNESNPDSYAKTDSVLLEVPTREGYEFKGWYTTATFEEETKVTQFEGSKAEDVTLYAKWEKAEENPTVTTTVAPTTKNETTTVNNNTEAIPTTATKAEASGNTEKKGCFSSISATASIIALMVLPIGIIIRKKREE